ncbi:MAG: phosphatase PAP2 family protein [Thermoplasmatota archaeon]
MPTLADVFGSFGIAGFLLATLLPFTILLGGAIFLPWTREYWSLDRARRVLQRHGLVLLAMILVVGVFVIVHAIGDAMPPSLQWDLTNVIGAPDGNLHAAIQAATPGPISFFLAAVYLFGFPALIYLTVFLSAWLDDGRTARRALAVYLIVYAIAVPFYLFVPVSEVWTTGKAVNLALVYPWIKPLLYSFNGTNNGFPSEHTAMAVAVAYVAWMGSPKPYAWFAVVMAFLVMISTIVLGIHWTLDVVAGLVVALVACRIVDRWLPVDRPTPRMTDAASQNREPV